MAMAQSKDVTAMKVSGSVGFTPNNILAISLVSPMAPTMPTTTPTPASSARHLLKPCAGRQAAEPERKANADFPGALPHHIRKDAINADAGQQQGKQREDAEQCHGKELSGDRVSHRLFHLFRIVDYQLRIELEQAATQRGQV